MTDMLLCKTQLTDVDEIVAMETHHENSPFIFPNTKEEHRNLLHDDTIDHLLLKSSKNEILGFVILAGLKDKNHSIELRRIVIKNKGKGFGRLAIKKIKEYCFEVLNCHRLWLDVLEKNQRAKHLYETEGFQKEGTLRECIVIDNNYESLLLMAILANEYTAHKNE